MIVVYHYIRDNSKYSYKLNVCSPEEFGRQLDYLSHNYKIVSVLELIELKNNRANLGGYCCLSFDDGIVDHYYILPELLKRGLKATFCPIACTFTGQVPVAIKMHLVFSKIRTESLAEDLENYLKNNYQEDYGNFKIPRARRINQKRLKDDILTANFKQLMSELPAKIKEKFANDKFNDVTENEEEFARSFFISPDQLKEIRQAGMIIGSHSYSHPSLRTLNYDEQKKEILESKRIISGIIGEEVEIFSYPFGEYSDETIFLLKESGFKAGILFNHRQLEKEDSDLLLSAYDCNDLFKK